jgi:hypothetical protein
MTRGRNKLATGREWIAINIPSVDVVDVVLPFAFQSFVLFLALDARSVSDPVLQQNCRKLLTAGARFVSVWGPDCSRVHDAFDLAALELGLNNGDAVIMTSWHANESLKEAVWFAANAAFPDEAYAAAASALVLILVGPAEWAAEARQLLLAGTPIADEA